MINNIRSLHTRLSITGSRRIRVAEEGVHVNNIRPLHTKPSIIGSRGMRVAEEDGLDKIHTLTAY